MNDWYGKPLRVLSNWVLIKHDEMGFKYWANGGIRDYDLARILKETDPSGKVTYDHRCAPPPPGYEVRYFLSECPCVVPIGWQDAKMRAVETERTRDEAEKRFKEAEQAWRAAVDRLNDLERTEIENHRDDFHFQ